MVRSHYSLELNLLTPSENKNKSYFDYFVFINKDHSIILMMTIIK